MSSPFPCQIELSISQRHSLNKVKPERRERERKREGERERERDKERKKERGRENGRRESQEKETNGHNIVHINIKIF